MVLEFLVPTKIQQFFHTISMAILLLINRFTIIYNLIVNNSLFWKALQIRTVDFRLKFVNNPYVLHFLHALTLWGVPNSHLFNNEAIL